MIKISEATAIALHSMIYMANRKDKVISLKEIAKTFEISENHLSKVLQRLVKAGVLHSEKGPKGGFVIVSGCENMTYLQVYEIIEGRLQESTCLFSSSKKNCSNCIMSNLVNKLNDEFRDYMENHKISDFKL